MQFLKAERVYLDAHFKAKVPHGREVRMERARSSWFFHTSNRKEETYKSMRLFSCLSLPTLARERRHPQWAGCSPFSPVNKHNQDNPPLARSPEAQLLHDLRIYQVASGDRSM